MLISTGIVSTVCYVGEGYLLGDGISSFVSIKLLPNNTDTLLSLFCLFSAEMLVTFFFIQL